MKRTRSAKTVTNHPMKGTGQADDVAQVQVQLDSEATNGLLTRRTHSPLNGNGRNGGVYDPAFTGNKSLPVHRWVPWIAGYSANFVDDVIDHHPELEKRRSLILDPFAGVGTTLVQAQQRGYGGAGFEINHYAWLVCKAKLAASTADYELLNKTLTRYLRFMASQPKPERKPPTGFRSRIPFFSPKVEKKILTTLDFIDSIGDEENRDLFRVALASRLVSFSNYSYEPSLSSRPAAGKDLVMEADVAGVLRDKIRNIAEDVRKLHEAKNPLPRAKVHLGSFLEYDRYETPARFQLAITSPPYLNNYHYVRNTRPHLFWLDLISESKELQRLEQKNIGKYWQTVRGEEPIELELSHDKLEAVVKSLRTTRTEAGQYGGGGWANYVASYFNDMNAALKTMKKALTPTGTAVVVVGNSLIQGHQLPVDEIFVDLGLKAGFQSASIDVLRDKRVGNSIISSNVRRGKPGKSNLYESAVILRASA